MRVNKFIRLWVHGGRGGIDDAGPPVKRTGVINAASPTSVSILLTFIITSKTHQPNDMIGISRRGGGSVDAGLGPLWPPVVACTISSTPQTATRAPTPPNTTPAPTRDLHIKGWRDVYHS